MSFHRRLANEVGEDRVGGGDDGEPLQTGCGSDIGDDVESRHDEEVATLDARLQVVEGHALTVLRRWGRELLPHDELDDVGGRQARHQLCGGVLRLVPGVANELIGEVDEDARGTSSITKANR
jgi:hypothetical protein